MKFFLIDDEYISNFINSRLIANIDARIETIQFTDSEEAYDRLNTENPDLLFLDINMPVMNGWDFLEKMKADGLFYEVVMLTSSVTTFDRVKSLAYHNIVGYVEKPATMSNMMPYVVNKIAAMERKKAIAANNVALPVAAFE